MDGHDAFGINKAFKKLGPKLDSAFLNDQETQWHDTMDSKLRLHSVARRAEAGKDGQYSRKHQMPLRPKELAEAKTKKKAAHGMYTAISRINKPMRYLP